MIVYDNRDIKTILLKRTGSVIMMRKVILPAVLSTAFCVLLLAFPESQRYVRISDSVARIYATVIGFSIVMRTNMGFNRFMDAVTEVTAMFSKWRDAFLAMMVFVDSSIEEHAQNGEDEKTRKLMASKARFIHWFSLLTAVAVQRMQGEGEEQQQPPSGEEATQDVEKPSSFFIRDAPREVITAKRVSLSLGSVGVDNDRCIVIGNPTVEEEFLLRRSSDKTVTILKWILWEVSKLTMTGVLLVPPPIVARVYQELSAGLTGYFMALVIVDVPFPFPFAQFLQWALYAFFFFCPVIVIDTMYRDAGVGLEIHWISTLITFLACLGYGALNEIAVQLEEPFGEDDNDYPMHLQQIGFVRSFEQIYFHQRPEDFSTQKSFMESEEEFEQRVDKAMSNYYVRDVAHTGKPPPNPVPPPVTEALCTHFDKLQNALLAATSRLQLERQKSGTSAAARCEERLGQLQPQLRQAEVPEAAGPIQADLQRVFDLVRGLGGDAGAGEAPADAVAAPASAPADEEALLALSGLVGGSSEPGDRERVQLLLQQHRMTGRLLRAAETVAREPSRPSATPGAGAGAGATSAATAPVAEARAGGHAGVLP